jgi:hypothetical protein
VLVTVLLLALGALGAWTWSLRGTEATREISLNEGTLGGAIYWNSPAARLAGQGGDFLNGLAAQLDRDLTAAERYYGGASGIADAQNNLGVVLAARGDEADARAAYSQALSLSRDNQAAAHNLGLGPGGHRVAFHNAYAPGEPMLSVPDPSDYLDFTTGGLDSEYLRMAADPWGYLMDLPLNVADWIRAVIAAVTVAVILLALVTFLLLRPRSARYERGGFAGAFAALLVPGSALADEVWGLLLLIPSAVVVTCIVLATLLPASAAPDLLGPASPLELAVLPPVVDLDAYLPGLWAALIALYVVNAIAWLIESTAARRRLAHVKARIP